MSAQVQTQVGSDVYRGLVGIYFDKTTITDIQGHRGELRYRGYSIGDLIANPCYEDVAYLLIHGQWPCAEQSKAFRVDLAARRTLSDATVQLLQLLKDAPPEVALRTAVSGLGVQGARADESLEDGLELVAKIPSMIVAHHALRSGRAPGEPDAAFDLASDFLRRLLGRPPSALESRIINQDFVLHADHGANASTFAARVVASTEGDIYGAFTAAIAALSGPLHGGAVAAVMAMLDQIDSPEVVPAFVADRRARGLPIYGFGHRVYRGRDPRADPYRTAVQARSRSGDRPVMAILDALVDAMAPFARHGIAPNVDLYAAPVYRLLGLSDDLVTVTFAAGRAAGWVAHLMEQQSSNTLIRPRLQYAGSAPRDLPNGRQ